MKGVAFTTIGLLYATAASVVNVGFEVAGKRALAGGSFLQSTLRLRALVAVLFTAVVVALACYPPTRASLTLFHPIASGLLHGNVLAVLLLSTGMVTVSILLYYHSLQVAPISLIAPLFGITPVFLLINGFIIFHRIPSFQVSVGVIFILVGTVLAHWTGTLRNPVSAFLVFLHMPGISTMLLSCLLLSCTNLLDQWLVLRLDVVTYAWLYAALCSLFMLVLVLVLRPRSYPNNSARGWILLAAILDASVLLLHFASLQYVDAVVTIAIKRSGMLVSVLAGSLFFQEKAISQRLSAAFVVVAGVLMMYFHFTPWALVAALAVVLLASINAFMRTRMLCAPE